MKPLSSEEFQSKVLTGVEAIELKYDNLDRKTKQAFEDLTKVKNQTNQTHSELIRKINAVQTALGHERRMAYGDPLQRILGSEEFRLRLNCAFRMALDNKGDMARICEPMMKALGEDSSPGSTLINNELSKELYDTLGTYGKWNTLAVRNVGTQTTSFPVTTARVVANFILTEGGTISDDENKAGTAADCRVEDIAALLNVSLRLLNDSEYDLASELTEEFIQALSLRLDHAAFAADGTSDATHGGMTGLFNFGTAAAAASGNTTVESLDLEDFIRCLTTVAAVVLQRRPRWWFHPHIIARTLNVKDSAGRPLFQTAMEAPSFGAIGSILGFPVELCQAAPSANTAGSKVAAFGDGNGYVVGLRRQLTFEASDHHKWNTLQRSFRGYTRAGTKGRRADAFAILTTAAS